MMCWIDPTQSLEVRVCMFAISKGHKARLVMIPKNASGTPTPVEQGSIVWTSSDETILKLTSSGYSTLAEGLKAGVVTVTVKADATLGTGVGEIMKTLTVAVSGEAAVDIEIVAKYS